MHQHGKEDATSGPSEASGSFSSNTFPLVSRSTMKRPFSLSSEREHQTATIRDHFRCRGFRSRSKTIHSDTFARSFQYRDLLGQSNAFAGYNNTDRSTTRGLFESGRRKPSNFGRGLQTSEQHKKAQCFRAEPILDDEEMAVDEDDDEDEDEEDDSNLPMFLDGDESGPCSVESKGKQSCSADPFHSKSSHQSFASSASKVLDFNSNPTVALCASAKSKASFLLSQNVPFSSSETCFGQASRGGRLSDCVHWSKLPTTARESKPTLGYGATVSATSTVTSGQPFSLECSKTPSQHLAIQKSLSSLAVPKSASVPFTDTKASSPLNAAVTHIPTEAEKAQFQRSLDSATTLVFHRRSGLPLTSSPAPIRKSGTCFDFDSSLTSVNAIKKALFENDSGGRDGAAYRLRSGISFSTPTTTSALLGNFEESVLNGRLEPASIVNGFTAEIGASGTFCPKHKTLPVTVFFYALNDSDKGEKISSPYLGHINLGPKGYHVPRQGTVQVTLFNPNGTVVKMFVVRYNLSDMPPNSRTFLRQRTLFMPSDANEHHPDSRKWLRYLIHLRFQSSKSGRIRLHTDMRILVFRKHDLDVATLNGGVPYELRSFVQMPSNPKYSKNIKS